MDMTILKIFSDLGVAGVLVFVVYYLLKYIKTKDDLIHDLLNVNQEQNAAIKEISVYMKEVAENQKACLQYSKYGRWWVDIHNPSFELCECCANYQSCPHPRKIVLRNRVVSTEPPRDFPIK
jgi:hypothetical protein